MKRNFWTVTLESADDSIRLIRKRYSNSAHECEPDEFLTDAASKASANITVVGHSAGGTLALWLAQNRNLMEFSAAMSAAKFRAEVGGCAEMHRARAAYGASVLAIAPIADLRLACELRLSDEGDAVQKYLGVDACANPPRKLLQKASPVLSSATNQQLRVQPSAQAEIMSLMSVTLLSGGADVDVPREVIEPFWSSFASTAVEEVKSQACCVKISQRLAWLDVYGADHFEIFTAGTFAFCAALDIALILRDEALTAAPARIRECLERRDGTTQNMTTS